MNYRKHNAEFVARFEEQPEKRDRIDSTGNGDAHAVPGLEQIFPVNVCAQALGE